MQIVIWHQTQTFVIFVETTSKPESSNVTMEIFLSRMVVAKIANK